MLFNAEYFLPVSFIQHFIKNKLVKKVHNFIKVLKLAHIQVSLSIV